jgi:hypothetical protein
VAFPQIYDNLIELFVSLQAAKMLLPKMSGVPQIYDHLMEFFVVLQTAKKP